MLTALERSVAATSIESAAREAEPCSSRCTRAAAAAAAQSAPRTSHLP